MLQYRTFKGVFLWEWEGLLLLQLWEPSELTSCCKFPLHAVVSCRLRRWPKTNTIAKHRSYEMNSTLLVAEEISFTVSCIKRCEKQMLLCPCRMLCGEVRRRGYGCRGWHWADATGQECDLAQTQHNSGNCVCDEQMGINSIKATAKRTTVMSYYWLGSGLQHFTSSLKISDER